MGLTEYIIVLCIAVMIWSNTTNADIDCRRFVFAPTCRGVSAKRSWPQTSNDYTIERLKEELSEEQRDIPANGDESLIPIKLSLQKHKKKRSEHALESRKVRSRNNMIGSKARLYPIQFIGDSDILRSIYDD